SLYHSKTYKGALGTPLSLSPAPAANNMHGANVSINDVRKADFWLDTSGLSFNYDSAIGGMGGIHNTWDFNGIEGRGYPTLIGVGGQ
ncbi:MAG: hypothetical protein FWH41_09640, partial [Treponema sp.]|nr:hypothetical protein [Treponema sp.]